MTITELENNINTVLEEYREYKAHGLTPDQLSWLLDHYITPNMIQKAKTADLSFYEEMRSRREM